MQKIMFYCQYLTGMGHLVRSTEIVRQLAKHFQVYFVNGGPPIEGFAIPPEVECIDLHALWLEDGKFQIPVGCKDIESVKAQRRDLLIATFDRLQPDCLITEFFPFGRHKLLFELLPLLERIKATAPATRIVCSLRDAIGRSDLAAESVRICQLVNEYFDLVLFHADPHFQSFTETFPRHAELNCEVKYTGFVAQSAAGNRTPEDERDLAEITPERPLILTSVGGGRLGYKLLETTVKASWLLADRIPHCFQIFTGPFLPAEQFERLKEMAAGCSNIRLRCFTPRLLDYMEKAELSISLTGYNTTMNILKTGVRALVAPSGHYDRDVEQLARTRKLEDFGIVEAIAPQELEPNTLAQRILEKLMQPADRDTAPFDLQGAANTATELREFLASPATRAVLSQPLQSQS